MVATLAAMCVACGADRPVLDEAPAGVVQAGDLELSDGYVTEPLLEGIAPAYLTIRNFGTLPDTLIRAASPQADGVALHTQLLDGGPSHMRPIARIVIEGGKTVALVPGGYHLMLLDLRVPVAAGDSLTLELIFARAGRVELHVPVITHLDLVDRGRDAARARPT